MRSILNLVISVIVLTTASCSSPKKEKVEEKKQDNIVWVNSYRTECTGVSPTSCLQIQKGETLHSEDWQMFYSAIEGFEYEAGYIYKLIIKEEKIKLENVPADGSSIKYTLVELLEKKADPILQLHDIYVVEKIFDETISFDTTYTSHLPTMEIYVAKKKITGTDGCNNYFGSIVKLNTKEIVFDGIGSTRKMCQDMSVPNLFNKALAEVTGYEKRQLNLTLLNANGKEVLLLKKVD